MWVLKGVAVGTTAFIFMSILYVGLMMFSGKSKATGTTALYSWTLQNPLYWLAFILVLVAFCAIFRASTK